MKSILFSMFLFAFVSSYAQQIIINATVPGNPAGEGEISQYWWWAYGVEVKGEDFTPNSTVTVQAPDPNGFAWREFEGTTNGEGDFTLRVNGMTNRSPLGLYNVQATDTQNLQATGNFTVIANPNEVINVTISQPEITINDFYYGSGIVISGSGLAPNGEVKINLGAPSANGMEIEPGTPKYADENGVFTMTLDAATQVGTLAVTYPIPQIPGVWTVSYNDFSGTNYNGAATFRMLPDILGEYCIPQFSGEVQPISLVEFSDMSKTSSLTSTEGYEDFTEEIANVEAGETYTIKLQGKAKWSFNVNTYTVFIDWNQNGIMDEEGEIYSAGFLLGSTGEDGKTVEYDITIPENALNGETRMRILKVHSPSPTAMFWPSGPCGVYTDGQIEDYTLSVTGGANPVVCTINCPENINVEAVAGATTAIVEYEVNFECDGETEDTEIVLTSGLPSGSEFPVGTTTVSHNLVQNGQVVDFCSFTVTVEATMGVSDLNNAEISFYPNPVTDILNISSAKEIANVKIFDLSGEQVYTQNISNKNAQINLAHLATGVYIVKAESAGEMKTFKIVKK